jgi:phage repressor protein C with HTH and peptisase S24 domain
MVAQGIRSSDGLVFLVAPNAAMAPYVRAADLVMLDTAQTEILDGEVYALHFGRGAIHLRRLSHSFDGGLILSADNGAFPQETLPPEQARSATVLGRCLWRAG